MKNYKALKSANKNSVAKVKIVTFAKVDEVKYKDGDDIPDGAKVGDIKIDAQEEQSYEKLQLTMKSYDFSTGAELDDVVENHSLISVKNRIENCKKQVKEIQAEQADWEELEKDLKAL